MKKITLSGLRPSYLSISAMGFMTTSSTYKMKHPAERIGLVALTLIVLTYLCLCLTSSASAAPLFTIEVRNATSGAYEESLTVLNPGDGNWIERVGGEEVRLPAITLVFDCASRDYVKGDKNVTLNVYGTATDVDYPFSEYHQYYYGDAVSVRANILGEDDLAGSTAYAYLVKTGPGKMNRLWNSTFAGDLTPFRDLLDNCVAKQPVTLNSEGDYAAVDFGNLLDPGDYLVLATLNESTAQNITIISAAAFEVLEYESKLEVTRTSPFVEGTLTINATLPCTYNYTAALIRKDEAFDLRWECEGAETELNLKLSAATTAESINILGGSGLEKLTPCVLYDWLMTFQTVSVEKGESGTTYNFSLPVMGMPPGEYYLYVMACDVSALTFASALPPPPVIIIPPPSPPSPPSDGPSPPPPPPPEVPCEDCFTIDIDYEQYLEPGEVDEELIEICEQNNVFLSSSAMIYKIDDKTWKIVDGTDVYIIKIDEIGGQIEICRLLPTPTPSPTPTPPTPTPTPTPAPTAKPTVKPERMKFPVFIPPLPFIPMPTPFAPVGAEQSVLLGLPLLGIILLLLLLLAARKRDVVDFGVFTPEEIAILDRTVYIPAGVELGRVLPRGATAAVPNAKLARELHERFDIPLNIADAIAIALERGDRLFLSDQRSLKIALSLGIETYLRPKIVSEEINNHRNNNNNKKRNNRANSRIK